ncbi:MAG: hypothetical protein KatS3mg047_1207 [Bellilinea sp.]|nr:MAG: hypothetical protein KatS3mg047_1207 [Bellilinea sp.]
MTRQLKINIPAPDFEGVDTHGNTVKLSDFRGQNIIVLVFNRGFM